MWQEYLQIVIYILVLEIGLYDHPDVTKKKTKPVQIEIQYSPHIELYCFDIAYKLKQDDGDYTEAGELIEF